MMTEMKTVVIPTDRLLWDDLMTDIKKLLQELGGAEFGNEREFVVADADGGPVMTLEKAGFKNLECALMAGAAVFLPLVSYADEGGPSLFAAGWLIPEPAGAQARAIVRAEHEEMYGVHWIGFLVARREGVYRIQPAKYIHDIWSMKPPSLRVGSCGRFDAYLERYLRRLVLPASPEVIEELRKLLYSLGFTGKDHIVSAEKWVADPIDNDLRSWVLQHKLRQWDEHQKTLQTLIRKVRLIDQKVDNAYASLLQATSETERSHCQAAFVKADRRLQALFPKFRFNWLFLERLALVAENIQEKMELSLRAVERLGDHGSSSGGKLALEQAKLRALAELTRMPLEDYLAVCRWIKELLALMRPASDHAT